MEEEWTPLRIRQVNDREWLVESQTRAGVRYTVTLEKNVLKCDCEGYHYRQKCTHVQVVEPEVPAYLYEEVADDVWKSEGGDRSDQ